MKRRAPLVDILELSAAKALLVVLRVLPYRVAVTVSEVLGLACGAVVSKWRRVADDNLRRAFPRLDAAGRRWITRGACRNLGRVALALAKCPHWTAQRTRERVEFRGLDHFRAARARGRGVVLLTAHLGNWELGALAHGAIVGPLCVMVRPLDNPLLDRLVTKLRSAHGNRVISKANSARPVLRALRNNETVGILADQNALPEDAVFVRFLGRTAAANQGLARLVMQSGAAVVPAVAWWNEQRRIHVVEYGAEVRVVRTGNRRRDVQANSQSFHSALERRVRSKPEQWLWIHRRWKTQPPAGDGPGSAAS